MRHAKQAHTRIPVPARPGACQLTVRDLGVTLEGTDILQDVSFQLNCREIVALIGPNGAGKSSLFRSILGQIPYTGTIKFELAGGYPSHPKIGYVPQSPSFDRSCPISVLDFFAAAISRWPVFLPVPAPCGTRWPTAFPASTARPCSTSASARSPAVSCNGSSWPWPWSLCPKF